MTKKRFLASLFLFLLISVGSIAGYIFFKGDMWKDIALNAINDNISTSIVVEDVEISIFSTFPQISVDLLNVKIAGAPSRAGVDSDTLLSVNKLGVAFSVWDVLSDKPEIRSIYLENGAFVLEEFASGKWNYDIGTDRQESSEVKITSVFLNQIDFSYIEKGQQKSTCIINRAEISKEQLSISFEDFKYEGISDVFVPLYGEITADYSANEARDYSAKIENGVLAGLIVDCELLWKDGGDIRAVGHFSNVQKDELEAVFVEKKSFEGWTYRGSTNLFFNTTNSTGRIDFKLPEAEFAVSPELTGLVLNNKGYISGEGRVDLDFKKDLIGFSLKDFNINSNGLVAELSGETIAWGSKPVEFDISATLDLGSSYLSWIPSLKSDAESYMPNQGSLAFSTLLSWLPSGEFSTSMVRAESSLIKGILDASPYTLANVSIDYSGDVLKVNGVDFNWAGNVGGLTSRISSFEDAMNGGAILGSLQINAESILIDPIFSWWDKRPNAVEEASSLSLLPNGSSLNYAVNSNVLFWDNIECTSASSRGEIGTKNIRIIFAKTQLLDGEATVSGHLKTANDKYVLGLSGSAEGFLCSELFRTNENFGQDLLRAEHIEGRGEVSGSMNLVWDNEGNWDSNSFDAELKASISNGRLKSLEVFDEIADYLKENRLIAPLVDPEDLRRRLSDVNFDYVETPVSVSMSSVSLPYTNIQSSAMNVSLEGNQTFEGGINYTLGFALRDLRDNKQGEFGNIQDDGLGNMFFLGMDGTLEEPVYSYDRKAHKAHRRRAINSEAQRIKDALTRDDSEEEPSQEKNQESKPSWRENTNELDDPEDDDF